MKNKLILTVLPYTLFVVLATSMTFAFNAYAISNGDDDVTGTGSSANISNGADDFANSEGQSTSSGTATGNISNGNDDGVITNNPGPGTVTGNVSNGSDDNIPSESNTGPGTVNGGISNGDDDTTGGTGTPGDTSGGGNGNGGSGRGSSGGGRSNRGGEIIRISDIQVTPVGSFTPTTTLTIGRAYVISWKASIQNVNTALNLVSTSISNSNISIGTSANPSPNGANRVTWTVPAFADFGDYILRFTDPNDRETNAPNVYKIVSASRASLEDFLGTGGGTLPSEGRSSTASGLTAGAGEVPLEELGDLESGEDTTQTASAISALGDFLNKYLLWFFILLLIIAGTLMIRERRNMNL